MAIITRTIAAGVTGDPDTIRFVDRLDTDLTHYFEMNIDEANNLIDFLAKIGDFRFKDADDSTNVDTFQITGDVAASGIVKKTSNITDSNIFLIQATGTIDGTAATRSIDYMHLDLDALVLNDAAGFAITLQGLAIDWNGLTPTATTISILTSLNLEHSTTAVMGAGETGINITMDKTVANNARFLTGSRDINGEVIGAVAITNYAAVLGQAVSHTAGDFIVTQTAGTAGILQLNLDHATTVATTNEDLFSSTALDINITADANVGTTDAEIDAAARAIDITYAISETNGVMNLDATDIFRINLDVAAGVNVGDTGAGNLNMILLDADGFVPGANIAAAMNISGIMFDASALSANDAQASIYGLNITLPTTDHATAAIVEGILITADTLQASNAILGMTISKDLTNASAGAGIAQTNQGLLITSTNANTEAQIMTISNVLADFEVINSADLAGADVYAGTVLNLDYSATTTNAGTATSSATGLLIDYNLTETAGTLTLDDFNIASIDFDTVGTPEYGAGNYRGLLINMTDAGVPLHAASTVFYGIEVDTSGLDISDLDMTLWGMKITVPTQVGVAMEHAALYTTDGGTHDVTLSDGSMGVQAFGISDAKYCKCEDFDEEAAAVQLNAGLRADEWLTGGLNDAVANVTYIQDQCGVLSMVTNGADDDSQELTWLNTAINTGSNPILEFRFMIDSVGAALSGCFVGFTETPDIQAVGDISAVSDDYFVVGMSSDLGNPANIRVWSENANAGQVLTELTGKVIGAATWCTVRMDFTDPTAPRLWINVTGGAISPDDEVAAATIAAHSIQDTIYVYPVLFVNGLDVTPTARTLLVDYVKFWQDRS